jgi:hypothetical protein
MKRFLFKDLMHFGSSRRKSISSECHSKSYFMFRVISLDTCGSRLQRPVILAKEPSRRLVGCIAVSGKFEKLPPWMLGLVLSQRAGSLDQE